MSPRRCDEVVLVKGGVGGCRRGPGCADHVEEVADWAGTIRTEVCCAISEACRAFTPAPVWVWRASRELSGALS